jgi:hypothetical protein
MADNLKRARLSWARAGFLLKYFPLLLFSVIALHGADDPRNLLLRASQSITDTVKSLPKYVCTQTVDRSRYELESAPPGAGGKTRGPSCDDIMAELNTAAGKRRLTHSDRLRLDVAVSHDRSGEDSEMYSWVGEERFRGRDLFEIVPDGAMATGTFSSMLASIFAGEAGRFSYDGDSPVDGRLVSEFGFRIPLERSQYGYVFGKGRSQQVTVGYHGSFFVDPETSDLVRLAVHTSQLPAETGACEVTRNLDYGRVRLEGQDFLLPTEARLSIIHPDRTVAENRIRYSACREFHSESRLRFEQLPKEADLPRPTEEDAFSLPSGLPFRLAFTQTIDTAIAAAGDPIKARLKTPIRDRYSKILVPEGALAAGRILSIRRFYGPPASQTAAGRNGERSSLTVAIVLEALEIGGISRPFRATFDAGAERFVKLTGLSPRVDIGPLDGSRTPGAAVFEFTDVAPDYVVQSGLESNWLTLGR